MGDRTDPKFAVDQTIHVKDDPTDDAVDSLGEVSGQTGKVFAVAWFGFRNCWSYGVLVDDTEYEAVEYDLEPA